MESSRKMAQAVLGLVGGSGLYDLPGIENPEWRRIESSWGAPSDDVLFAEIDGLPIRFLPRHGRGHRISPTEINYRANIDCLKRAGVTDLVSISACGSFKEELAPGKFVLVDQGTNGTYVSSGSGEEVYLRREEMVLRGQGSISLGKPVADSVEAELIHYEC